jgi:hypothetical protein
VSRRRAFPLLRTATAAGLAVVLCFLMVRAAQRGLADLHARQVTAELEAWEKERKRVPLAKWKVAYAAAEAAQRLTPGNPDAAESLGRVYDWAAFGRPLTDEVARSHREQALSYFREAVRARPVSGYTWANIAQAKLAIGAVDGEFTKAVDNAALLAPWEPEVQLAIVDAGFAAWSRSDATSRKTTAAAAARALKRHAKDVFAIARHRGRVRVVCEIAISQNTPDTVCR